MSDQDPIVEEPAVAAAVQAIETYWEEMARRWPWMRQQSLRPIYILAGEMLIALTRRFPVIVHSNDARWYAREIGGTPSIYVIFPDQFRDEARKRLGTLDPRSLEGKQAITFLYLARVSGQEQPSKTLLLSTEQQAPMFQAQVAHELLHCACAMDWSGDRLRVGSRLIQWGAGAPLQHGGLVNDLLIDTLLLDFLPAATKYTRATLLDGPQGPYWRIADALGRKLPREIVLGALYGADSDRLVLASRLGEALERSDAVAWLDRLLATHDWAALSAAVGVGNE
jgi:hypothetical protein